MSPKAIRLESGEGLSATFVPEAGMIGISLIKDGEELLGQRHGFESYVESGKTMGIPVLYPWANRLARDSWEFAGRTVILGSATQGLRRDSNGLAIHGTLAASPLWQVDAASTGSALEWAGLKASLEFGDHPELLDAFPFPHRLELEITLARNSLTITTTVTPTGGLAVPLAYGFHPYISLPGTDRREWAIDLPAMTRLEADDRGIPTGETRPFAATTETLGTDAWDQGFSDVEEGSVFAVADRNWLVSVNFESGYPAAQVFAPSAENVICFEPMKAPANALVTGLGLGAVEPGDTDVSRFVIEVSRVEEAEKPGTVVAAEASRGFRIEREAPAAEVKRVARDRVQSALRSLRDTGQGERTEAIHETRKDLKKMRSVLRLVRGELDRKTFREENHRYRDAARLLSGLRDDDVLLETIESLRDGYPDDAAPLDRLVEDLESRRDRNATESIASTGSDAQMKLAAAAIEQGANLIDSWTLEHSDWDLFEKGLRRTYRDGRLALAEAEGHSSPEKVHEWRKRVKDLWYQLRLLRNAWKTTLRAQARETGQLAELLGEYNDLSVLVDELNSRPATGLDYPALRELAVIRQKAILEQAFPLGHRIYAEEPSAFVTRIGSYWSS